VLDGGDQAVETPHEPGRRFQWGTGGLAGEGHQSGSRGARQFVSAGGVPHDREGYVFGIPRESNPAQSLSDLDTLGALEGKPLVVLEVSSEVDLAQPVSPALPCTVVAVARDHPSRQAPSGVDVALCRADGLAVPYGWVAVPDTDSEVGRIAAIVDRNPQAAVLFAQTLRLGATLSVAEGLLVESLAYSVLQAGSEFRSWLGHRREAHPPRPRSEPFEAVLVARTGDLLQVTLNRPHVRNAVNVHVRDGLAEAFALAAADASILRIELTGSGPDFSAGGDLDEFGSSPDPVTSHLIRTSRSTASLVASASERLTANLHGSCIGAGIELAAFSGTVISRADVRIQLPEVALGLLPGSGGTVSIPRRIGRHRTAWLGLSSAFIDAETAASWGLVDEVTPRVEPVSL
jgi:enoyl-CoA hydratase/carnithine racemase